VAGVTSRAGVRPLTAPVRAVRLGSLDNMAACGDAVSAGQEPAATDPLVAPRRFADLADRAGLADRTLTADRAVSADRASLAGVDDAAQPGAGETATLRIGLADRAALTAELEAVAFRGWPPLRAEPLDGWVLRDSAGATRRGNSVWAHGDVADLPAAIAETERFYARAGRPPTFQLTPVSKPEGLDDALDAAGYDADSGPTDVCVVDLAALLAGAAGIAECAADRTGTHQREAVLTRQGGTPDDSWLDVGAAGGMTMFGPLRPASVAILSRITLPVTYVTATLGGEPVGVGRGVVDGDWLGIYSMATLPAARRRGAATAVLAALARWSAGLGARRAYLQVEQHSVAARRIYAALGFRPVYRYTYRRRLPTPVPVPSPMRPA